MRPSSPLSFLQDILPILWTRGPGQMVMVTGEFLEENKRFQVRTLANLYELQNQMGLIGLNYHQSYIEFKC
jgi:hypothetical protein